MAKSCSLFSQKNSIIDVWQGPSLINKTNTENELKKETIYWEPLIIFVCDVGKLATTLTP